MSSDEYEAALEGFVAELNKVFRVAGPPSFSELQKVSERLRVRGGATRVDVLTKSNTNEILNGRRRRPPRWHRVHSFLIVLRTIARRDGISTELIGTDAEWKRRYDAVCAAQRIARRPVGAGRHRKPDVQAEARTIDPVGETLSQDPSAITGEPGGDTGVALVVPFDSSRLADSAQWRHQYRDISSEWLDTYVHLESAAAVVRTYEPRVIPSLLQAEDYARQIVTRYCPSADSGEVARLVAMRLRRQSRLNDAGFRLWAIVDETGLADQDVDVHTMRVQITHLINVSERANVTLQLLLSRQGQKNDDHVTIREPITQFRFPEEDRDDVVFLERPHGGVILTDRKEIAHYSRLLSRIGIRAVSTDRTRDRLRQIFMRL